MISQALLMAAGLGTRLRPFTELTPKALLPVMGIPIAKFAIDALVQSGVDTLVANIHHHAEAARIGLLALGGNQVRMSVSDESEQLMGSAGGIRQAAAQLKDGPFFVANADVLCDIDWRALESCHQRLHSRWGVDLTLALHSTGFSTGSYREIHFDGQQGLVTGLGALTQGRPFYLGAAVIESRALEHIPTDRPSEFVPTLLEPAIRNRRVGVYLAPCSWYDIGSPDLWLNTHLALISRLELGEFPSSTARSWRKSIEEINVRHAERIWTHRGTSLGGTEWACPAYWDGEGAPPVQLGPRAILYGDTSKRELLQSGIGYHGLWQQQASIAMT